LLTCQKNKFKLGLFLFANALGGTGSIANDKVSDPGAYCSHLQLQVLGAGGPEINDGLASSSFLVWINGKAKIMVDAGGGSSLNFEKSGADFNDLDAILLTHLHVDHSAALPVYIKAGYFSGRENRLPIFGPFSGNGFPSTENFIAALFNDQQLSAYPYLSDNFRQQPSTDFLINSFSVKPENKVWKKTLPVDFSKGLSEKLTISAINVHHSFIPAIAWRVDYQGCSITFSGDMNGLNGHLEQLAQSTNLLVANNAIPEGAGAVAKRLHMTPSKISEIAKKAKVKKILLAHVMNRTIKKKNETGFIIQQNYNGEIEFAKELTFVHLN